VRGKNASAFDRFDIHAQPFEPLGKLLLNLGAADPSMSSAPATMRLARSRIASLRARSFSIAGAFRHEQFCYREWIREDFLEPAGFNCELADHRQWRHLPVSHRRIFRLPRTCQMEFHLVRLHWLIIFG